MIILINNLKKGKIVPNVLHILDVKMVIAKKHPGLVCVDQDGVESLVQRN